MCQWNDRGAKKIEKCNDVEMYWICISFNAQHTYVYIRIPHGKKPNRKISEFHQRLWDYAVIMFDLFSIIAIENEWISRSLGSNATYLNGTNRLTFLSICSKLPNSLESGNKWLGIREWTKKTTFFCATIFVQLSHSAANAIQSTQFKNSYGKACVCGLFVCVCVWEKLKMKIKLAIEIVCSHAYFCRMKMIFMFF